MKYSRLFLIFIFLFFLVPNIQATEYIAFSLKVAQDRIVSTSKGEDYRKLHPEVFSLGGITAVRGLVYDRKMGDIVLVGERNSKRAPLTLDDFVVGLRARFIYGKWPLVSIDPTEETKKTDMQRIRFEGGIENTQFGEDLFDADYSLKKIGMGLLAPGIPEVKSAWDLGMNATEEDMRESRKISSRFWFYPVLPDVTVRVDVVAIKGLRVGIFTELLSAEIDGKEIEDLSTFQDITGNMFAKMVSDNFEKIASVHPSFSRVQGLDEIVALTKALEEMEEKPDLSYWLKEYQIMQLQTKKELKVLRRKEDYVATKSGKVYRVYREISGGVQLMAIALKLKAGEITALKEAVLRTRPKDESLSWSFIAGEWLIPTSPEMLKMADMIPLFTQAVFLQEKRHYDDAIALYGKISDLKPEWDWVYNNRANAYDKKGQDDQAIRDYTKALEINPKYADAYYNRAYSYVKKGQYDQAILDYNKALEINPRLAQAYNNRGNTYEKKGQYDQAILDYDKALEINPRLTQAYCSRGNAYHEKGEYDRAILDYSKALEINPRLAEAYQNRGVNYNRKGQYDQAALDFDKALEINPKYADAYHNRGINYYKKGQYDQAILDYDKALEINPGLAEAYYSRGAAYHKKKEYNRAILDYSKALEINPMHADAYHNRALVYAVNGLYDHAILDCNKALETNPRLAQSYFLKALVYEKTGRAKEAIEAYKKFIESAPDEYLVLINEARERVRKLGGRSKR